MQLYSYVYVYIFLYQDIAVIVFQTLCHVLRNCMPNTHNEIDNKNITTDLEIGPRKTIYKYPLEGDPIIDHPTLLSSLLNGLAVMTEKFKLKWQECVETICLFSLAQELLNHPGASSMVYFVFSIKYFIKYYKILFSDLRESFKSM